MCVLFFSFFYFYIRQTGNNTQFQLLHSYQIRCRCSPSLVVVIVIVGYALCAWSYFWYMISLRLSMVSRMPVIGNNTWIYMNVVMHIFRPSVAIAVVVACSHYLQHGLHCFISIWSARCSARKRNELHIQRWTTEIYSFGKRDSTPNFFKMPRRSTCHREWTEKLKLLGSRIDAEYKIQNNNNNTRNNANPNNRTQRLRSLLS